MTTENQSLSATKITNNSNGNSKQLASKLEERKGNAMKPLSLRPNRSVKKNTSMKPIGFKSR